MSYDNYRRGLSEEDRMDPGTEDGLGGNVVYEGLRERNFRGMIEASTDPIDEICKGSGTRLERRVRIYRGGCTI